MVKLGMMISDRYEIIEKIGSGGMADVFRAKCHRLNRFVAIKFLRQEYSQDAKFVTKFRGEAQSVAGLSHPNIVSIYDVGEDGDLHYIVMEYIEGITLKKYIEQKGKLSIEESVGIALQIANGLNAAHKNSIVHRDIKPQNILLSHDGTAKVTDFGIAKAASSNTITSNAMGSVHYISPEQARGGFSDEKSDIYSLGVTMYEMLTGTLPFTGESPVAVALSHVQDEAESVHEINSAVPIGLSKIVQKCMQKKQELRYLSAEALIEELRMFLQNPNGEYGVIESLSAKDSPTKFIPVEEVKAARKNAISDEMSDEEDEDSDVDPKLEKALVIGSIVVAIIIGLVIIVMLAKFLGLFGNSSSNSGEDVSSPSPTVSAQAPGTSEMISVPDVANLKKEEASTNLSNEDLVVTTVEEESDEVDEGYVIRTNPAAGTQVEKNSTVEIVVSSGPVKEAVPDVSGKSLTDATTALTEAGFKVKEGDAVYSDTVEANLIAKTSPAAGEKAEPNATITVYKSKGKEAKYKKVPNLTGLTQSKAKAALISAGLKLGKVSSNYSDTIAKNRVCGQSYSENQKVKKDTAVDITLSLGKKTTYKYLGTVVIRTNPFASVDEGSATIKFVLSQDGKDIPIREEVLSYTNFPYTLYDVEGTSANEGEVKVYKDGQYVTAYNISFSKVAQ